MKNGTKVKSSPYLSIMIIPDANNRPKSIRIAKWLVYPVAAVLLGICLLYAGMSLHINGLKGKISNYDTAIDGYSLQLKENADVVLKLEDQISELKEETDYYTEKLQSLIEATSYIEEKTAAAAFNNSEAINKVGELLGITIEGDSVQEAPSAGDTDQLPSRSATRPKIDTSQASLEQNYAFAMDELHMEKGKAKAIEQSSLRLLDKVSEREDYLLAYPSTIPVNGRISCNFGKRNNPFGGTSTEFHKGLDIAVASGTAVKATGRGKVIRSEYSGGYGYLVAIDHGFGMKTYYAHNSKLLVNVGDIVERGDTIARSGSTGRSTGPHVHYEVRIKDNPVDPLSIAIN